MKARLGARRGCLSLESSRRESSVELLSSIKLMHFYFNYYNKKLKIGTYTYI